MKKYTIIYGKIISKKDIRKIPLKIQKEIEKQIREKLTTTPEVFGKPLKKSLKGFRRMRIRNYRVIFRIIESVVEIMFIGKKPNVYQQFLKRFAG